MPNDSFFTKNKESMAIKSGQDSSANIHVSPDFGLLIVWQPH
jgi:hypothetical protein